MAITASCGWKFLTPRFPSSANSRKDPNFAAWREKVHSLDGCASLVRCHAVVSKPRGLLSLVGGRLCLQCKSGLGLKLGKSFRNTDSSLSWILDLRPPALYKKEIALFDPTNQIATLFTDSISAADATTFSPFLHHTLSTASFCKRKNAASRLSRNAASFCALLERNLSRQRPLKNRPAGTPQQIALRITMGVR